MAVTMCRGYSTFYGHILCTVLLISCLGGVLCQSTSDATTSDSISPTPSTTAISVEGTTSVQAATTESTMTNTTLSESHSLDSSITDSVTSNPSSYGTLPYTSFSFISDSVNPTDISNIKSTSFVSSSQIDFSATDFMSTSHIYTSEFNYVSSSSMGNYISTSINNSMDMLPTSSSKSEFALSALAPSNTPMLPQVTPSNTPMSPQVTPSDTPMSPQVTPSNTPISPQVTPTDTPMSPQVTPSDSSSLDKPNIGESTMPSTSMIQTEIHPSATSTDLASSSTVSTSTEPTMPTTTPPTTPTPTTTTTTTQKPISTTLSDKITVSINENSLFRVEAVITTFNCTSNVKTNVKLRQYILDTIKLPDVRDVIVVSNPCNGTSGKRKKRDTEPTHPEFQIILVIAAQNDVLIIISHITSKLSNNSDVYLIDPDLFNNTTRSLFNDPCNSNICDTYVGYVCKKQNTTAVTCDNRCATVSCSGHGTCKTIVTTDNNFATQCICDSEDYYKYEGESCETKRMKWELAVAISAGSCGAVIVILVFGILICCCCKRREDKYEYFRPGYEPMSDVLRRPGPAYYRNEGVKSHQTGFTNFGYDDVKYDESNEQTNGHSWNPEDSKDTYAKISQKLDESSNLKVLRSTPHKCPQQQSQADQTTTSGVW